MVGFNPRQKLLTGSIERPPPSTNEVSLTLTEPPDGYDDKLRKEAYKFHKDHPVMMQSVEYKRHYIYAPRVAVSGDVQSTYDDQGDGALWVFDPPLPEGFFQSGQKELPAFKGHRCMKDCHNRSRSMANLLQAWGLFLMALGLVLAGGLICFLTVAVCNPCGLGLKKTWRKPHKMDGRQITEGTASEAA